LDIYALVHYTKNLFWSTVESSPNSADDVDVPTSGASLLSLWVRRCCWPPFCNGGVIAKSDFAKSDFDKQVECAPTCDRSYKCCHRTSNSWRHGSLHKVAHSMQLVSLGCRMQFYRSMDMRCMSAGGVLSIQEFCGTDSWRSGISKTISKVR